MPDPDPDALAALAARTRRVDHQRLALRTPTRARTNSSPPSRHTPPAPSCRTSQTSSFSRHTDPPVDDRLLAAAPRMLV
ncbi:hypothetical protein ACWGR4_46895 [Embleya sp. NPDC055664]